MWDAQGRGRSLLQSTLILSTVLLAAALFLGAVLLERSRRPGWLFAWSALLVSGACLFSGLQSLYVAGTLTTALFPALLARAAYQFAERAPPRWLIPVALVVATVRGGLRYAGWLEAQGMVGLVYDPAMVGLAATVAHGAAAAGRGTLGFLVAPLLALVALVEVLDVFLKLAGYEAPYALWVAVGVPAGTVQLVSSISALNRSRREALRASEERFRQLAEGSRAVIMEVDAAGRLVYVSPNVRALLGVDAEGLKGRGLGQLVASAEVDVPASPAGEAAQGLKHRVRDARGKWHWLDTEASVYRSPEGEVRVLSVSHDVTAHVETAEKLRASDERLREILSSLPETRVVLLDRDARIHRIFGDVDPERYGIRRDATEGQTATMFVDERSAREGLALVREIFDTGEQRRLRQTMQQVKGEFVWDVTLSPLHDAEGAVAYVMVVARDVTERVAAEEEQRQLEAQLHQSQKRESLGILAGGIAHDFNNLLVGVLGNAELALEEAPEGSQLREALQEIVLSSERASELTHQLVAYAGDASFEVDAVDLSSLLKEMGRLLRTAVPTSARLAIDVEPGVWVQGDSMQLQQVMMNLITNAGESLEDGAGTVRLHTGRMRVDADYLAGCQLAEGLEPGEYAFFEVADDGSGVASEVLPQIFDPFFTTKFRGRGLGLAATLGIVRGHGGALRVDSAPGQGTRVRVLLPRAPGRSPSSEADRRSPIRHLAGTVLVVDDQRHVLRLAARMLRRLGMVAVAASSGEEALRIFRERHAEIDVVLLDLTMPGTSGDAVLRGLRGIRPDVPVVLMSGHSERRVSSRLVGETRVARLHKPFQLAVLAARLEEALRTPRGDAANQSPPDSSR